MTIESAAWRAASGERPTWRNIPAWAQYAVAVLVLGVSVGAANLNIHYDRQAGLTIRTGWGSPEPRGSQDSGRSQGSRGSEPAEAVSRAELTALAQQLRGEIQAVATPVAAHAATPASDADTLRRVHTLLDDAEKRHERELALKVAEVLRDVNMQRQADLRKIDQNLYALEGKTGVEVLKNRQMIDMYLQRVSQRQ